MSGEDIEIPQILGKSAGGLLNDIFFVSHFLVLWKNTFISARMKKLHPLSVDENIIQPKVLPLGLTRRVAMSYLRSKIDHLIKYFFLSLL